MNSRKSNRDGKLPRDTSAQLPGIGMPDRLKCKLKYAQQLTITGTPTTSAQVFRLNSLYDPDVTGAGHQPQQFDQLLTLYTEWVVTGCQVNIKLLNGASDSARVVVVVSETNNSSSAIDVLGEYKYADEFLLGPSGSNIEEYKRRFDLRKLLGQEELESDPNMYVSTAANPQDVAYLWIKAGSLDGIATSKVYAIVELIYECVFKGRVDPTQS